MADFVLNIAKGAFAEKFRDGAANGIVLLLSAAEAQAAFADHDDLAALLGAAGNTEVSDASYARKTGLTGTVTVDDSNDRVDVHDPDKAYRQADRPKGRDVAHAAGGHPGSKSGKEAREHYKRLRGFLPA